MQIAISGANGLIGSRLTEHFLSQQNQVITITRSDLYGSSKKLSEKIDGCDVVIHLAGAPIMRRHNKKNKNLIYNSRIVTTKNLVAAMAKSQKPAPIFISTSAIGIYSSGHVHSEEEYEYAMNYMAKVCKDWEKEAMVAVAHSRVIIFRFGIVLDKNKGALASIVKLFKYGLGGKIASGKQTMAWVHIKDVISAYDFAIQHSGIHGAYNVVSPGLLKSKEFTKQVARQLHKPHLIPAPTWGLRLLYGKGADLLTIGQSVVPKRLLDCGFQFKYMLLKEALSDLLDQD